MATDEGRLEVYINQVLSQHQVDTSVATKHIALLRQRHTEANDRIWAERHRVANIEFAQAIGTIATEVTRETTGAEVVLQYQGHLKDECWTAGATIDLIIADHRSGDGGFAEITLDSYTWASGRKVERRTLQAAGRPQLIDPSRWDRQFESEARDVESAREARKKEESRQASHAQSLLR